MAGRWHFKHAEWGIRGSVRASRPRPPPRTTRTQGAQCDGSTSCDLGQLVRRRSRDRDRGPRRPRRRRRQPTRPISRVAPSPCPRITASPPATNRRGTRGRHRGARAGPRQRRDPTPNRDPHQLVPRGMELHLVDPVPVAVVGAPAGRGLVGQPAQARASPVGRRARPAPARDRAPGRRSRARGPPSERGPLWPGCSTGAAAAGWPPHTWPPGPRV
jgi:hypothetical protein